MWLELLQVASTLFVMYAVYVMGAAHGQRRDRAHQCSMNRAADILKRQTDIIDEFRTQSDLRDSIIGGQKTLIEQQKEKIALLQAQLS